jgi:hypothetical protein
MRWKEKKQYYVRNTDNFVALEHLDSNVEHVKVLEIIRASAK